MDNLKTSTKILLKELVARYPDQDHFRKNVVVDTGKALGYTGKDWDPILTKDNRVRGVHSGRPAMHTRLMQ